MTILDFDRRNAAFDAVGSFDLSNIELYAESAHTTFTDGSSTGWIVGSASSTEGSGYSASFTGTPEQSFFSAAGQVIEQDAHNPDSGYMQVQDQYVWGIAYVNELVLRDDNSTGATTTGNYGKTGSGLDERFYVQQDANYNVTSIVDVSGNVKERFVYDPYGNATVLNDNGVASVDWYNWTVRFQGGVWDPETGLIHFGVRNYDPVTATWKTQDPAGYAGSGPDLYQFVESNPLRFADPTGRSSAPFLKYPFMKGHGSFDATLGVHITSNQVSGPNGGTINIPVLDTDAIDVDIKFFPNNTVTAKTSALCTKIDFVQYYKDVYMRTRFSSWTWHDWKLDDGDPYGSGGAIKPPPMNNPWTKGGASTNAHMQDSPGDNNEWYWKIDFKSEAIARTGTQASSSYGMIDWGLILDYSRNVKQYYLGGKISPWLPIGDTTTKLSVVNYIPWR